MKIPLIMNTSLHAYLEAMRQFPFLAKRSPQQYFRRPGKDFTRTRILHLERVAWLNITLLKCTFCVELDQFFDWLDAGQFSPTKNALVQARQRFLPMKDFFRQMLQTMEPVRLDKNKERRRRLMREQSDMSMKKIIASLCDFLCRLSSKLNLTPF